jgi:hypothetical protein
MPLNFLTSNEIHWVDDAVAAAANTDADSAIIDTAGCESVVFFTAITDCLDTGVATLTVEQNTANSASGMAALAGAVATATSAANDDLNNTYLAVEVKNPRERYLRVNRTSATANVAFGEVYAIKVGKRLMPGSDPATLQAKAVVASPAES